MKLTVAFGAQSSLVNLRGWHARPFNLALIYFSQIETNRVRNISQFCVVFTKLLSHIYTHLITAFPDARTNGDVQIFRTAGEFAVQFVNGVAGNVSYGSTPAGVDRSDSSIAGIDDQDRYAVRRLDCDKDTGRVFDEGVSLPQRAGVPIGGDHGIGMDLVESGDIWTLAEIFGQPGAKTMHQPIECIQQTDAIDVF